MEQRESTPFSPKKDANIVPPTKYTSTYLAFRPGSAETAYVAQQIWLGATEFVNNNIILAHKDGFLPGEDCEVHQIISAKVG